MMLHTATKEISTTARRVREAILDTVSTFTVPGVQVAWLCDGTVEEVAAGTTGLGRVAPVTAETRFPLGSVTKVFTASLALQLVGDDVLSLDDPILGALPPGACRRVLGDVTLRQLLTHTSGMENDHASGDGPFGSTREYVRACEREKLFAAGAHFSYANAGYVVVGHLVEEGEGQSWAESVQSFLLDPLEVRGGFYLSEAPEPGTMADGHLRRPDGEIVRVPGPARSGREWAPAGGLALNAAGLLRLVQLHLDGGRTALGYPLLDTGLVAEMRAREVVLPDPSFADGWGMGWALFERGTASADGVPWFGHDGEDEGWTARVRASEDGEFAIVMLANCMPADEEWRRLQAALDSLGMAVGEPDIPMPAEPAPPVDPDVVGTYENGTAQVEVVRDEEGLWLMGQSGHPLELRPVGRDRCVVLPSEEGETAFVVAFLRDDERRVQYVHVGGRIARRAA